MSCFSRFHSPFGVLFKCYCSLCNKPLTVSRRGHDVDTLLITTLKPDCVLGWPRHCLSACKMCCIICALRFMLSLFVMVQDALLLRFTPQTTGMTWREYINLYCAGSKQIFLHETPKYPLQFGLASQAINQSRFVAQRAQTQNMCIAHVL